MQKTFLLFLIFIAKFSFAQEKIIALRIRPYTDSVKIVPMLSYFVNVESITNLQTILPVMESDVQLSTTFGTAKGLEIFFDKQTPPDSFVVKAVLQSNRKIEISKTLYVQKVNLDPAPPSETNTPIDTIKTEPKKIIPQKKKKKKYF
jgi:hypothetical protein